MDVIGPNLKQLERAQKYVASLEEPYRTYARAYFRHLQLSGSQAPELEGLRSEMVRAIQSKLYGLLGEKLTCVSSQDVSEL